MTAGPDADPAFRILLVCTGNICRSAFAERLGRAWLDGSLGEPADGIELSSAATRAVVGAEMHPGTVLALRGYGAEPGDFRARRLTEDHPARADPVLTMTRAHHRRVLGLAPRALARTLTLREAADLLDRVDDDRIAGADAGTRARGLVTDLAAARPGRPAGDDDVPDPIDGPPDAHEEAGDLIVGGLLPLLRKVVDLREPGPAAA